MTANQDAQRAAIKTAAAPRIEAVRGLAAQGMTSKEIATALDMTRGAVMGLVRRNEIVLHGSILQILAPTLAPPPVLEGPSGCRFPLWNHTERPTHAYCNEKRSRRSYCDKHAAICYRGHQWVPESDSGFVLWGVKK